MTTATLSKPKRKTECRYDKAGNPILPNGYEYVNGHFVEKPVSEKSGWVSGQLYIAMGNFVNQHRSGVLFNGSSEQAFQCFPFLPKQIRRPDVAFVNRDLTSDFLKDEGYTSDVPALIAEVISPRDRIYSLDDKLAEFLDAGTKLIWVINPVRRTAKIIHSDGIAIPIDENGILDGEDVLPGLKIILSSILPPK